MLSLPLHSVLVVQHTASYYDLTVGSLCTLSAFSLEPPFETSLPIGVPTSVTVRHMYTATAAAAPDYGGPTSATSKGNARGKQAVYI